MTAAKKTSGPAKGGTYEARAAERWKTLPDWVLTLAQAADAAVKKGGNLRTLGESLGDVSASTLSAVLGNTYPGSTRNIEARVRGKLMSATVPCPVLGELGRDKCVEHQTRKFSAANPRLVKLAKACPTCPNFLGGK